MILKQVHQVHAVNMSMKQKRFVKTWDLIPRHGDFKRIYNKTKTMNSPVAMFFEFWQDPIKKLKFTRYSVQLRSKQMKYKVDYKAVMLNQDKIQLLIWNFYIGSYTVMMLQIRACIKFLQNGFFILSSCWTSIKHMSKEHDRKRRRICFLRQYVWMTSYVNKLECSLTRWQHQKDNPYVHQQPPGYQNIQTLGHLRK